MLFQSCRLLLTLGDPAPVKIFNSPRAKLRSTHSLACKILEGNLTPWAFLRPYSALDLLPFLSGLGLLLLAVGSGTGWPSPWPGPGAKSSWRLPLSHRLILIWESSSRASVAAWLPAAPRVSERSSVCVAAAGPDRRQLEAARDLLSSAAGGGARPSARRPVQAAPTRGPCSLPKIKRPRAKLGSTHYPGV